MICPKCGLPEELCVCEEIKTAQKILVYTDKRKFGKVVTIVDGIERENIEKSATELKRRLACGGTIRDNKVELQGDHKNRVPKALIDMGFPESIINVVK